MELLFRLAVLGIALMSAVAAHFLFGLRTSPGPVHWTVAWGSSPWMSQSALFIFNIVFAVLSAAIGAYYKYENRGYNGFEFYWYLTHWSLILQTLFMILVPFANYLAMKAKPNEPQPGLVSFLTGLLHVQLPLSLIVTMLYWFLLNDVSNLCILGAHSDSCDALPHWLEAYVHGLDLVQYTFTWFASRMPFELENAGWLLLFYPTYLIWTVFHYLYNLGEGWPLYSVLDWSNPALALPVGAGCMVGFALSSVLCRGLAKLRQALDESINGPQLIPQDGCPLVMA